MNMRLRTLAAGAMIAAGSGFLSACSTAEGMLSPGKIDLNILGSAATDVVLRHGFSIKSAPVCEAQEQSEVTYTCAGRTLKGKPIKVVVTGSISETAEASGSMAVLIGSEQIFDGPIQDVLDQRMLANP